MYAGIDLGTTFTKTHTGLIFPSGISKDIYSLSNNVMTIDGIPYSMEQFHNYDINVNKILNENVRLNYLYALYKITSDNEYIYNSIIIGLPASQWKNDDNINKLKKILDISAGININVNGFDKNITVKNLEIIPEGSTAYYAIDYSKFNSRKTLIIDWGGLTMNTILFQNDEIIDVYTDEFGSLKIYKEIAGEINSEFGTNIKIEDIHDLILHDIPMGFVPIINNITMSYCKQIYKNLKLKWDIDTIPYVSMVGGSSLSCGKYLAKFIPHLVIEENPQMLSAIGMGIVARMCTE